MTPLTATNAQVAVYADAYYEYYGNGQVSKSVITGSGCSCAGNNTHGTMTYSYGTQPSSGPNGYYTKTSQSFLNESGAVVWTKTWYCNDGQQPIFMALNADGINTYHYYTYDPDYRLIQEYEPSAIVGYTDNGGSLLTVNVQATAGLVHDYVYGTTTTATALQTGTVSGYLDHVSVQQGSTGTPITLEAWQYTAHADNLGNIVYPVATHTAYRNADGTGAETTSMAYTWQGTTNQIASRVVSHPSIPASENGPGEAESDTSIYDVFGRTTWTMDGEGYITYSAYDPSSSGIITHITDVNTARTQDFDQLPTGWSTPAGGGLHLVQQYAVDPLARTTQYIDANGHRVYTVYSDAAHQVNVYRGWNATTNTPTGPTEVERDDRANGYIEQIKMTALPAVSQGIPTGAESIAGVTSLSRSLYDLGHRTIERDDYFDLTGIAYSTSIYLGALNQNYYATYFGYDSLGNLNRQQNAVGTITRTVFDSRSRETMSWIGTNDTPPTGYWSPSNNAAPSNMVEVSTKTWDSNGSGDNLLTSETIIPTHVSSDNRVTQHWYDWRDRHVASKAGVNPNGSSFEDTTTHRPLILCQLDNLDECIQRQQYDSDGWGPSVSAGLVSVPASKLGMLRAQTTKRFDERHRVYQETIFAVDQSIGTTSSTGLVTNTYYDFRNHVIATSHPGGLVSKMVFDGAGRVTLTSETDGAAGADWLSMSTTDGDHVLRQRDQDYDGVGNVLLATQKERFHNELGIGDLNGPSAAPYARNSFTLSYYDAADRPTAMVDIGTNGGQPYDIGNRPAVPPTSSDTIHVASVTYAPAGWLLTRTDPRGLTEYDGSDALGRVVMRIEAWDGSPTPQPTATSNRITNLEYDGLNHITDIAAENYVPATAQTMVEETSYAYGATTPGSVVNSNDVLVRIAYPDPVTGQASTSTTHQDQFTYISTGQLLTKIDGNGSAHQYYYTVLGQSISDQVITVGAGVDGSVRRIDTTYDTGGRPAVFTSYADVSGTQMANQVSRVFNGLSQIQQEWQSTSGQATMATPSVVYGYTYLSGGLNNSRLTSIGYPNGRTVGLVYTSGIDNAMSRVSAIVDGPPTSGASLESYAYLGLAHIIQKEENEPGIINTVLEQPGDAIGDGGDAYVGLDRFDRLLSSRWILSSTATSLSSIQYGYDQDDEQLYANNLVNPAFSVLYHANGASEATAYDNFGRLQAVRRGALSASGSNGTTLDTVATVTDPTHGNSPIYGSQEWTLDQLGNWTGVESDTNTDTRTHNAQNELTADSAGALGYDNNGNLKTQAGYAANTYDAWNRATSIRGVTYAYDALGRRIWESANGGRAFFYDGQRMIETRTGPINALSSSAHEQYVYGQGYIDDVILRDAEVNGGGNLGINGSGLDQRIFYQQDREFNVVAITDQSGNVVERYAYDPYGSQSALDANWNLLADGSAYGNQIGFTGRWLDSTGMWYFRHRYEDPVLGRFTQRDPIGYQDGHDLYCACFVSNGLDPSGLCCKVLSIEWKTQGVTPTVGAGQAGNAGLSGNPWTQVSPLPAATINDPDNPDQNPQDLNLGVVGVAGQGQQIKMVEIITVEGYVNDCTWGRKVRGSATAKIVGSTGAGGGIGAWLGGPLGAGIGGGVGLAGGSIWGFHYSDDNTNHNESVDVKNSKVYLYDAPGPTGGASGLLSSWRRYEVWATGDDGKTLRNYYDFDMVTPAGSSYPTPTITPVSPNPRTRDN